MTTPWIKFYPSDWRSDPMLRMCSVAARGLWIEMLCIMHESGGYLLVNGKPLTPRQLAVLTGSSPDELKALMAELEEAGVYSRADDGTIYSRRMLRDIEKAEQDKANGRRGGNPKLKEQDNPPVNPPTNPTVNGQDKAHCQIPEARKNSTDANASGAVAPADPRLDLFHRGLETLVAITGKPKPRARQQIGRWLKLAGDDAVVVMTAIEDAVENQVIDPSAWIEAALLRRGGGPPNRKPSAQDAAKALQEFVRGTDDAQFSNIYPLLPAVGR